MNKIIKLTGVASIGVLLVACGGSSTPSLGGGSSVTEATEGPTSGMIDLTGNDVTSNKLPSILDTGYIGASPSISAGGGVATPNYILVVDSGSTVSIKSGVQPVPAFASATDRVQLNVIDSTPVGSSSTGSVINLEIKIAGLSYAYECISTTVGGADCGGNVALDIPGRTVSFNGLVLTASPSSSTGTLTLNGTLSW